MKTSSVVQSIAGALVASLLLVTATPAHADPASPPLAEAVTTVTDYTTPLVESIPGIPTQEELATQAKDADAALTDVRDNGNTIVLRKGHFERRGDMLAIIGESGQTLLASPLVAVMGQYQMPLTVTLKDRGQVATFSPQGNTFCLLPTEVNNTRADLIGDDTRLRAFYNAWGQYLNRMTVENFQGLVFGGIVGGVAGIAAGWAIGFLAGATVFVGMGSFKLIPFAIAIPVAVFLGVGIVASLVGATLGSIFGTMAVGLFSPDPKTRDLAVKAITAAVAMISLWWLPPSADKLVGSGVGPTSPEQDGGSSPDAPSA